ncbi:hypothetical protein AVEN_212332-1 [Araneus ventricosus]|uniref:Uncharacterized protein n=1 Tax=Araneus ventricosus TaxID=182803 RepID=A0A4Y2F1H3_ARAVE|nr:hypothetical protein AVEN_212332-1 [Araneus ventricosus]
MRPFLDISLPGRKCEYKKKTPCDVTASGRVYKDRVGSERVVLIHWNNFRVSICERLEAGELVTIESAIIVGGISDLFDCVIHIKVLNYYYLVVIRR